MERPHQIRGHRALRSGRASIPGQIYLVTIVCSGRQKHFAEWTCAALACAAIAERRLWRDSSLLCWVLMPDHLHVLVSLGSAEPLPKLIQRVKAVSALAINRQAGNTGAIWMPAYHERALRSQADVRTAGRYIVANPVRARLVRLPDAYPFWDAVWLDESPAPCRSDGSRDQPAKSVATPVAPTKS